MENEVFVAYFFAETEEILQPLDLACRIYVQHRSINCDYPVFAEFTLPVFQKDPEFKVIKN